MKFGNSERQYNMDFIRGLAIILVMVGHAIDLLIIRGNIGVEPAKVIYDIIYTFHMPLIFSVSGYVSYWGNKKYLNKKLGKKILDDIVALYVPYLFLNYSYLFEKIVANVGGVKQDTQLIISVGEIVKLLYSGAGLSWFLLSLLLIKIITNILTKYTEDFWGVILFSLTFWLCYCGFGGKVSEYLGWGIFYFLGYLVNKYKIDKLELGISKLVIVVFSLVICCGIAMFVQVGLDPCCKLLVGMSLFCVLAIITRGLRRKIFIISFCGEKSIVVYIMHGLSQFVTYSIVSKFIIHPIIIIMTMCLLQILISYTIFYMISNIKILKWCNVFFYPGKYIRLKKQNYNHENVI